MEGKHFLTTSGGKLNTEKCDIYITSWDFKEDGTPTIDSISNYQIPITSFTDVTISYVKSLYPDESILYLRHSSQLNGNQQGSLNILLNHAKYFARRVISTSISRQQVSIANNSIIKPKMKYPLFTTAFSDN